MQPKKPMRPINQTLQRQITAIGYILGFMLFSITFDWVYLKLSNNSFLVFYLNQIAIISRDCIGFLAPENKVFVHNNALLSANAYLEVDASCSGSDFLLPMAAAMLVFKTSLKQKLFGIIFAAVLISALNLARIVILYLIKCYQPIWFVPVHEYIAPGFNIIVCCLYFLYWALPAKPVFTE
ncbi:exosortase family protein XrtM [Methylomonas methanica]|uniref:Exosortase EpsH-related protein n=1 Tax=Methylomonas methanica (strain DSM 25384 / MC09) TaxID=857087 RepID=F9ZVL9_METMM|nr:exosortase family protein XrtM [Methylomonas methanica]AEG02001.1 Exosortase EpsH-related protein [Methylomonas methanica MC09]